MDEIGPLLDTETIVGKHDEELANTMNEDPSDRHGVEPKSRLMNFRRVSKAGKLFRRATGICTTTTKALLHNGKLSRKTGTVMGILLIFLLSISLVVLVILSDVRASRKSPVPLAGFQHGKDTRSTMDIVYSCLSTMVISSISAVHLNILSWSNEDLAWRLFYWTFGLLMPEYVVGFACYEYLCALIDLESVGDKSPHWTLKHSFFARMGGFEVDGTVIKDSRKIVGISGIDWEQIGRDISDKSKKDVLGKSIAVIQIGRFLLAMISRAAGSLPISPLESFTCAQVVCALLMYTFWFDKPHNVQEPIRITTNESATESASSAENYEEVDTSSTQDALGHLLACYAATLVGASALGQWNAQFSTRTSQVLWRTFSIVSALVPILSLTIGWVHGKVNIDFTNNIFFIFLIFHGLNRIVLIVFVFYSFSNLPADVYTNVNWLNYIAFIQ